VGDGSQSLEQLTESVEEEQLAAVRECLNRQRPFGKLDWQAEIASRFGLGSTLRPRGRPRSEKKSSLSSTLPFVISFTGPCGRSEII
jgi:hypothetical protein